MAKQLNYLKYIRRHKRIFARAPALTLLAILSTTSLAAQEMSAAESLQAMPLVTRLELEAMVSRELQRAVLGKFRQIEGARHEIKIQAHFDLESGLVIVDMGPEYGPLSDEPAMEDLQKELSEVAGSILRDLIPYQGIDLHYGGKDYFHYHPEDRMYQDQQWSPQSNKAINDFGTQSLRIHRQIASTNRTYAAGHFLPII